MIHAMNLLDQPSFTVVPQTYKNSRFCKRRGTVSGEERWTPKRDNALERIMENIHALKMKYNFTIFNKHF